MAIYRTLDLNNVQRPTLELALGDENRTVVHIGLPKEADIQELQRTDFVSLASGDSIGIKAVYELAARLINFNRDDIKVTGAELRGKYGMDLELVVLFFNCYMDFITEVTREKNSQSRTTR